VRALLAALSPPTKLFDIAALRPVSGPAAARKTVLRQEVAGSNLPISGTAPGAMGLEQKRGPAREATKKVAAGCADQFRRRAAIERDSGADRCTPPPELRREQQIDSHAAVKRLQGARAWVAADDGSNGEVGAGSRSMLRGRAF
jgi:hypothetical protein